MNTARYLHDNGDCWDFCQYCAWEDERDEAMADNEGNDDD